MRRVQSALPAGMCCFLTTRATIEVRQIWNAMIDRMARADRPLHIA